MSEAPPNHPTDDELRALSLGQLAETELVRVSAHLGDCPACCRCLDGLTAEDPLLSRLQQSAANRDQVLVGRAQRRSAVRALRRNHELDSAAGEPFIAASVVRPVPRQIGDYDILAEVGRGGMGVVYRARHRTLHRPAALKMVLAGEFASPTQELRFRLEAELAARVQHPNIVQVYEIGSHEGRPFLALEWVEGGSLADQLDGTPWPPEKAAALVETLARAIHVAHGEGVVHRDLKPANILRTGGEGSNYKITDFGLAQPTEGGQTLTRSGFLAGTPGYMAPEQAGGKRALMGPATDIYSLGVVLYELITGRLPFQSDSTLELLRAVASDEPTRPRHLQPRLPRDLEAITLHCLEKEPARRYPSALSLAEDLRLFREGKQVAARPVGTTARMARSCRRHPVVTMLLFLLLTSLVGGLGGVTWKWLEADAQRDRANAQTKRAADEKKEAEYQGYRARLAAAGAALQNHDVVDAARQLEAASADLRGWEWQHLQSRLDDSSSSISVPSGEDNFLIPGPNGLRVGTVTSAGLRLTELESGASRTVPIVGIERARSIYPTQTRRGLRVAKWIGHTAFELLDESGRVLCRVDVPEAKEAKEATPVVVSPDGARLACHRFDGKLTHVMVFDANTGEQIAVSKAHISGIWALAFSPDGSRLASAGEDQMAKVWDSATGTLLANCQGHTSKVLSAAFSPDGAHLVTTSSDGTVRQWNAVTGLEVEPAYDRHSGDVTAAAYSPDGNWVASAGTDRTVRVWRAKGRQDMAVLHGHTGGVAELAFVPGRPQVASLSNDTAIIHTGDRTVRVWDVGLQSTLPVLSGHTSYVYPVAFSPDGRWIASGSWDTTVRLWDAATGELVARLPHLGVVTSLAFGPDGEWLVSGNYADRQLRFWDVATARVRREIEMPGGATQFVAVSKDGKRVAATTQAPDTGFRLHVFDIASGEPLFSMEGRALAYSPDGRWLAITAADDTTLLLLDAQSHKTIAWFRGHDKTVFKVAFSLDGSRLATCSEDRTVRVWEINGGGCHVLRGHTDEVYAVAFHPDGKRLASAGRDRAVWLWDLDRGEEVARLQGHTSYVRSLAFSPDGTTLVSGSGDTTVRLWDTAPLKVRHHARREAAALRAVLRRTLPPEAEPGNPHGLH